MNETDTTTGIISLIETIIQGSDNPNVSVKAYMEISSKLLELFEKKIQPNIQSLLSRLKEMVEERKHTIESAEAQNLELQHLIVENQDLARQAEEINRQYEELNEKKAQIEELKRKRDELNKPENKFCDLEDAAKRITLDTDKLMEEQTEKLDRISGLLASCGSEMDTRMKNAISTVRANLEYLNRQSHELMSALDTAPLQTVSERLNNETDQKIASYNFYVKKIKEIAEELKTVEEKYQEIVDEYRTRYDTDREIFGSLEEPAKIQEYLTANAASIEEFLKRFEDEIVLFIEKRSGSTLPEIYERQTKIESE